MNSFSTMLMSITGGAMAWIYGLVLLVVVIYTIIALRKQAKKAENKNKRQHGHVPRKKPDKDVNNKIN